MNKEYKKRINAAVDFILKHQDEDLSLDEIAQSANFSKYHFHRIFKSVTNETVSAFIRRIRLEKAANRLLSDTGETITMVAFDCGFTSSQNFATAFKKHFRMSPKQFKETYSLEKWQALNKTGKDQTPVFQDNSKNDPTQNLWINLMEMPSYNVAYERIRGPYDMATYDKAFEKLLNWAYRKCDISASLMMGIIWDNPDITDPEQCRFDICVTVPEKIMPQDGFGVQEIKGGLYVVGHSEISTYQDLENIYETIFSSWFTTNDYIPLDSPSYEIYLNQTENHPRKNLLIDICIPVTGI